MNFIIPNYLCCLASVCLVVWTIAGVQACRWIYWLNKRRKWEAKARPQAEKTEPDRADWWRDRN